jgi:adenosylcobyric acid synthase
VTARAIMLFGTGSDVGKSLIAAGLCRHFANQGLRVAPFKPQNMSNNAAVTVDGGEIGRAQALQARAARIEPTVHLNPVLLKPESGGGAQVIVRGRRRTTCSAREYFSNRRDYLHDILASFAEVSRAADLVVVEGAGSPAEINLRNGDLANLGFAEAANIDGILIGDIHRGGVIASVAGTFWVIGEPDRQRIRAFIINNFHGDPQLFAEGRIDAERLCERPCLGVVPHFPEATRLPAEDSVALARPGISAGGRFRIAVPQLPRIANFDDLDPLRLEPDVAVEIIPGGKPLPLCDLIIIPGSKSTIADLAVMRDEGWDIDILAHARRGGFVLGLCGGYQMLGTTIDDPAGIEGPPGSAKGLGLLDVHTVLQGDKTLSRVSGLHTETGSAITGYEIHLGKTTGEDCSRPFSSIGNRKDGAVSRSGRIMGTYLHGCFNGDAFRGAFLASCGATAGKLSFDHLIDRTLDELADHLARHIDLDRLLSLSRPVSS